MPPGEKVKNTFTYSHEQGAYLSTLTSPRLSSTIYSWALLHFSMLRPRVDEASDNCLRRRSDSFQIIPIIVIVIIIIIISSNVDGIINTHYREEFARKSLDTKIRVVYCHISI